MSTKQNNLIKTNGLQKLLPTDVKAAALDCLNNTLTTYGLPSIDPNEPSSLLMPVAVVVTKIIGNKILEKLKKDFNGFKENRKIKDDYFETSQYKACLQELLLSLEDEKIDEKRLEALNKIFLVASTEELSNRNDPLPLEYMRKCRSLTAGEILVLVSEYNHVIESNMQSRKDDNSMEVKNWLEHAAKRSGLKHPELVEEHEMELISKHLLDQRSGDKNRYVILKKKGRLSDLGFGICEYIKKYDEIEQSLVSLGL